MKDLTERQTAVLDFITNFSEEKGWPPSVRDVANAFGITVGAVQNHLNALRKKGRISWAEKRSRTLKATSLTVATEVKIPILGTVRAGGPLYHEENIEGYESVAMSRLKKNQQYFALRVRGDSMTGAGILDGDLAIFEQRTTAENGQIVVAVVNDAITVKRFFKEASRVKLHPENPAFPDIFTQDVRIAGTLFNIIRRY